MRLRITIGSLNLGLDRARFQSETSVHQSVINLENFTVDDIMKLEEDCRDQFEKKYQEGKFIGEVGSCSNSLRAVQLLSRVARTEKLGRNTLSR